MARPNILLITSDQQRADAVGFNNRLVRTPHLDALAARGIVCERAYTCNPVCTPARVSILTGHYPSRHGCYTIGTSLPEDYPTIPREFARAGYFTALLGKAHFRSCSTEGSFEAQPNVYDLDFFDEWSGPYHGFERARLSIGHGTESHAGGMHYGAWLRRRGIDPKRYFGHTAYTDFGVWDLPAELHYSQWTADETIQAIDTACDRDAPFLLWSSFQDPHNPCFVPEPWASMYDEDAMPVYRERPGEHADKPPFYAGAADPERGGGAGYGGMVLGNPRKNWHCVHAQGWLDDAAKRSMLAKYYGMVSLMDHHIGRIIAHLEHRNMMDNTVIVFTSDHGDYFGNHGMWWKGLPAYEDAHRVPFVVYDPEVKTPGQRSRALQSLVDLPRTWLARSGISAPPGQQGYDQTAAWQDASVSVRDHAFVEFRPTEGEFMQTTYVTDRHKLVVYTETTWGELYDLAEDPDQYRNLWSDPAYSALRAELLQRLAADTMRKDTVLRERTMWA